MALANIHRDRLWWRKVLVGGALTSTVVGYPWVAGFLLESLDNTRRGFPTPLPRWSDWGNRYVLGLLAVLVDMLFFIMPLIGIGLLFLCGGGALALAGGAWLIWLAPAALGLLLLYELFVFACGVAPIGRLIFAQAGRLEDALSLRPLRAAWRPSSRLVYARTRLRSLPAYLPALLLLLLSYLLGWPFGLLSLWLALSALCYAQLVVGQLYVAAAAEAQALD